MGAAHTSSGKATGRSGRPAAAPAAVEPPTLGLREQKKLAMRRAIQDVAIARFTAQGYDETSVAEIAEEVGISPMTFYRYYPTKESVVLDDDYDPMIADVIASLPVELGPVERVRRGVGSGLAELFEADREVIQQRVALILATPALRASFFDQYAAVEALIAEALSRRPGRRKRVEPTLGTRVVAAACASVMTTAVFYWAERGFVDSFPELMDRAFDALIEEVTP